MQPALPASPPDRAAVQAAAPERWGPVLALAGLHGAVSLAWVAYNLYLVELLVRAMRRADGKPGLGSGWLTLHAAEGAEIAARVRTNRAFHAPSDDRPLILIGNGTGLAGLRAHLKARAAAGRHRNWLVFGERTAAHDYFHQEEIEAWRADGVLQRLDLAFSRDQDRKVYVQHRLMEAADALRAWVADGAAIYVCGSLEGMSGEVHATLTTVLGAETMERLADEGRYRRDVY